jgi:hypothetical protein
MNVGRRRKLFFSADVLLCGPEGLSTEKLVCSSENVFLLAAHAKKTCFSSLFWQIIFASSKNDFLPSAPLEALLVRILEFYESNVRDMGCRVGGDETKQQEALSESCRVGVRQGEDEHSR